MIIEKSDFGSLPDGREVYLYTLKNDEVTVSITNYGGIITSILAPDKAGTAEDIVLGFDTLEGYLGDHPYFGAIIGRFANRIAGGKFHLNGREYNLLVNNGPSHLHGGGKGFDKKLWDASTSKQEEMVSLLLSCESQDGEEGYPGKLKLDVTYSLNKNNELAIDYMAESDNDTILNLTNHSYFNLNIKNGDIKEHILQMKCKYYTPLDDDSVPTGEILSVKGTPFDFTNMKLIGEDFDKLENGFDHNYVIDKVDGDFVWFGKVVDPLSGRVMEVGTTEPGVQFYTSNFLKNIRGKNGILYNEQHALCLETQHFPDSPNKPHFPSVILRKGEQYRQKTVYKFDVE